MGVRQRSYIAPKVLSIKRGPARPALSKKGSSKGTRPGVELDRKGKGVRTVRATKNELARKGKKENGCRQEHA